MEFWAPSVDVSLAVPFTVLNKIEVTPIAIGGAIFPLGSGPDNGDAVGRSTGGHHGERVQVGAERNDGNHRDRVRLGTVVAVQGH